MLIKIIIVSAMLSYIPTQSLASEATFINNQDITTFFNSSIEKEVSYRSTEISHDKANYITNLKVIFGSVISYFIRVNTERITNTNYNLELNKSKNINDDIKTYCNYLEQTNLQSEDLLIANLRHSALCEDLNFQLSPSSYENSTQPIDINIPIKNSTPNALYSIYSIFQQYLIKGEEHKNLNDKIKATINFALRDILVRYFFTTHQDSKLGYLLPYPNKFLAGPLVVYLNQSRDAPLHDSYWTTRTFFDFDYAKKSISLFKLQSAGYNISHFNKKLFMTIYNIAKYNNLKQEIITSVCEYYSKKNLLVDQESYNFIKQVEQEELRKPENERVIIFRESDLDNKTRLHMKIETTNEPLYFGPPEDIANIIIPLLEEEFKNPERYRNAPKYQPPVMQNNNTKSSNNNSSLKPKKKKIFGIF